MPHMRNLISIDFPARNGTWKRTLRYQLSPFPGSNAVIAMQHHPSNIHQSVLGATPLLPGVF